LPSLEARKYAPSVVDPKHDSLTDSTGNGSMNVPLKIFEQMLFWGLLILLNHV
jgi:hypothetical protein